MALSVPSYLKAADIQSPAIRYEWDDWKTIPEAETPDESLVQRLEGITMRAALAFMAGTVGWIEYRFATLCDDPAAAEYAEGAWALVVDSRYCGYGTGDWWQTYAAEGWSGPVKGPMKDVFEGYETAVQQLALEGIGPADQGGWIAAITSYVMPDKAPYQLWSDQVLTRLEQLYPRSDEDPLGDVVPKEAVNPDEPFAPEDTERLVNGFLASLDHTRNRFLSSPEGMRKGDVDGHFGGTPYTFDIEADRASRRRG